MGNYEDDSRVLALGLYIGNTEGGSVVSKIWLVPEDAAVVHHQRIAGRVDKRRAAIIQTVLAALALLGDADVEQVMSEEIMNQMERVSETLPTIIREDST